MIHYPHSAVHDLGFESILKILKSYCLSDLSQRIIDKGSFFKNKDELIERLNAVKEFEESLEQRTQIPIQPFANAKPFLHLVRPKGAVLDLEQMVIVYQILVIHSNIFRYFERVEKQDEFPSLFSLIKGQSNFYDIESVFSKVINEDGEIRENATPELKRIRLAINQCKSSIDSSFNRIVRQFKDQQFLIDSEESYRNGRRVLAVKAEYKRKIRGIIHDESTTGKTVFIEPEEIININNDLFELEVEERKEIFKILQSLCDTIREFEVEIFQAHEILSLFDLIRAKSLLSRRLGGVIPKVVDHPVMNWINASHPLLMIRNEVEGLVTVPSDFILHGKNRILLISGPNAGGKSIALKTVGLLQMMIQFGIPVPVDGESEVGLFDRIMVDIGDQQSLENDLSTYSSRLQKLSHFLDNGNEKTLVLIDEFGSGTDPQVGGAIAESALFALIKRKCFGVITTHYSNLKVFAFRQKGIVNASMFFDKEAIKPTYQLIIGKPGSSFAFEIAEKMKINPVVIEAARKKMGEKAVAIEEVLISLQRERADLQSKLATLDEKQANLDKLIKSYENLSKEFEYKRKKMRLTNKEKQIELEGEYNRNLENTIRELKESKNLEKAKEKAKEHRVHRVKISEEIASLQEEVSGFEVKDAGEIVEGGFVRMKNGMVTGKVQSMDGNKVIVLFGSMTMTVKKKDLVAWREQIEIRSVKSVTTSLVGHDSPFKSRIDIRGLNVTEALDVLERYFDQGVLASFPSVSILHGKGTGVLKKMVRQKAKEYPQIKEISHPEPDAGGDGISIIHFV